MTTLATRRPAPLVPAAAAIHGEIISWDAEGLSVRHAHLVEALADSGLDPAAARAMLPRNAFARACRRLSDRRIIRKVDEGPSSIRFQFTAEQKDDLETILTLGKATGAVDCSIPELVARARVAVDEAMGTRHGGDVTRLIQRLFDDRTRADLDLVPVRPRGGVYFVRRERLEFVDRVESFLSRLNARLIRLPVAAGSVHGDRGVREAVASRLGSLIGELDAAVEAFGSDTRERTLAAAAERVRLLRHKVDSYAAYLDSERGRLSAALEEASARLRGKVAEFAAGRDGG